VKVQHNQARAQYEVGNVRRQGLGVRVLGP
jgi:hypothetical protein